MVPWALFTRSRGRKWKEVKWVGLEFVLIKFMIGLETKNREGRKNWKKNIENEISNWFNMVLN